MATNGLYGNSPSGATVAAPGAATSGLYGSGVTGQINQVPGAETVGLYGQGVQTAGNTTYFLWNIFQQAATQPATPTGGSWSFLTNSGIEPAGWSDVPPPAPIPGLSTWLSYTVVTSNAPTATLTWTTPGNLSGVAGGIASIYGTAAPTNDQGNNNQFYIQQIPGKTDVLWWKDPTTSSWVEVGAGNPLTVESDGQSPVTDVTLIDFEGEGVSVIGGGGQVQVNVPGTSVGNTYASNINFQAPLTATVDVNSVATVGINLPATTNTLTNPVNTITSIVDGIVATAPAVNTVALNVNQNVLTTTVNGVAGTVTLPTVPGTTNTLSYNDQTNVLTSTVDGVVATATINTDIPPTTNTLTRTAGSNTLTSTVDGVVATASVVDAISGQVTNNQLQLSLNGVQSNAIPLPSVPATTNTLTNPTNTITSTVDGVVATAPAVNTVVNTVNTSGAIPTLTTLVNGVASTAVNLPLTPIPATTNTLTSSVNTLTSTVDGVAATASAVNSVALAAGTAAGTLKATVNGVASNDFTLPASGVTSVTAANNTITIGGTTAAPTVAVNTTTETTRIDAEIAVKVGSVIDPRTQVSGGSSVTGVVINQVVGQPVQMTVTTANIDVTAQVNLLNGGNRFTVANTTTDGATLLVTSFTAGTFQITMNFDSAVTLAQVQALFSSTRSDSVYAGTPTSGNFTFQNPPRNEIISLINQNVPTSVSQLPFDVISWTNDSQVEYVSDKAIPQQTVSVMPLTLSGTWEFPDVASIPGFTDGAEIIGTDTQGRTVSGVYTAGSGGGFATMAQVNSERTSNFAVNTLYPMVWRQGIIASAAFYVDSGSAGSGNRKVNTLSPGTNITITDDPLNPGRSVIASTASGGGAGSPWFYPTTATGTQMYTIPSGYTTNTAIVVLNGSTLVPTTDYTISGTTLTIVPTIATGDLLGIAATGSSGGAAALPFSGNGITGSVTPTSIVMGTNTAGSFNAATSALTISATGSTGGVTSLDGLTGALTLGSSNNSLTFTPLGTNIDIQTNPSGQAGTATGYNIGQFVQSNVSTYAAPTQSGGQLWMVQLGTGTGYSSDNTIITPSTTTGGWKFFGQQAKNVVAELGAQTQLFRMTLNGQAYQYNRTPAQVLGQPHFLKTGRDINTTTDQFPGFVNDFIVYADLQPVNTLVAEARLCLNSGNAVSAVTNVSFNGQNVEAGVPVCTITHDGGTVATSTCTLPLEARIAGNWIYVGSEWPVSATPTSTTTQLTLTSPLATYPNDPLNPIQLRIQEGSNVTKVYFWQTAFRGDLVLGMTTLNNATYELRVQPNTWTEDSAQVNPSGFSLPATYTAGNNNQFNFAWGITNGDYITALPNTNYWHYNSTGSTVTNSPYTPNTAANWNNRITVNVGATVTQKWTDYATRWLTAPVFSANATQTFSGVSVAGKIYQVGSYFRFVPNTYSSNYDTFWTTYSSTTTPPLSGFLASRATL